MVVCGGQETRMMFFLSPTDYRLPATDYCSGALRRPAAIGYSFASTGVGDFQDGSRSFCFMSNEKVVATNREAYFNYHLLETYECGIALTGTEVKSIREGRCNLKDS